jgi:hypothetical protein
MGSQKCEPEGVCTREVYEGWWARGKKYFDFLNSLPKERSEELGMLGMHESLIRRFTDEVVPPNEVPEVVDGSTYGVLLHWNRQAETLAYYVTHQAKGSADLGPTTPGLLEVGNEPQGVGHHWPWIEGWDDPKKRALILNPEPAKKRTAKKILLVGGIAAGAFYVGKQMLAD